MFLSPKIEAQLENGGTLTRQGVVKTVRVPENLKGEGFCEVSLDGDVLEFVEGDSIYILADKIGILHGDEDTEANLVFFDGGVLMELVYGQVAVEGTNIPSYVVNQDGEIVHPDESVKIQWISSAELYDLACLTTGHKFCVTKETEKLYVDNFIVNTFFQYSGGVFKRHFAEYFDDLALGVVEFINYKEEATTDADFDDDEIYGLLGKPEEEVLEFEDDLDFDEDDDEDEATV